MAICKCQSCIDEAVNGKLVSQSTYRRHNKQNPLRKNQARFYCICSLYPSGHYFRSKSAYYTHRQTLNLEKSSEAEHTGDDTAYNSVNEDDRPVTNHSSDPILNIDNGLVSNSDDDPILNDDDNPISDSDYDGSDQQNINKILEELSDNSEINSGLIFI
jgi:hypothetical protein